MSENKIYTVGIGSDIGARVINAHVQYALENEIRAANDATLSAKTMEHSTGHSLMITHGRFTICPKQADQQNPYLAKEAGYHKKLVQGNPSMQRDLFDASDHDNQVFAQLLFGKKRGVLFAALRVLDSSCGIYEE